MRRDEDYILKRVPMTGKAGRRIKDDQRQGGKTSVKET